MLHVQYFKLGNIGKDFCFYYHQGAYHLIYGKETKQQLVVLENISLPYNEQLVGNDGSSNTDSESPAIQLILSDKNMGWKAALRRILVLSLVVSTLGKSCAKGKKNSKSV